MDDVRRGQIALLFLKHRLREKGVRLTSDFKREIGNIAKTVGISIEEAMEFAEFIVCELVEETFTKTNKRD